MRARWLISVGIACVLWGPAAADLRREVEPNGPASTAQPVVAPASIGGTIGAPGDVDLYSIAVRAGQILRADILARGFRAGSKPGSQLSALLRILDSGGTVLAQDQSLGDFDDPTVDLVAPASGVYLISVTDLSPLVGGTDYRYVLSVELDSNDTFQQASQIVAPVLLSIDTLIYPAGDRDNYRVQGRAGQVMAVDIDSAVFNPTNPPAKIVLTVLDGTQSILAQDAYTAADPVDPFLQLTLPADGSYVIEVRELRSFVGTTNTFYQLSVELGPSPGNDSFATGMPVGLPRQVSGTVSSAADVDHYRVVLPGGTALHADLDARADLQSLLVGTLKLNSAGGTIASDSSVPDPSLTRLLPAGEYSVSVQGPCTGHGCNNEDSYYVMFLDDDLDGDALVLPGDNCPTMANPGQSDGDADGVGDVCDNCVAVFNPDQIDTDANGVGDACQLCSPPGEVALDLEFIDAHDLAWTADAGVLGYGLYRGVMSGVWDYNHSCVAPMLSVPQASDPADPGPGQGYYYLVSGRGTCGEGSLGADSNGMLRSNTSPCP